MPIPFDGTVLSINRRPASGVAVRVFDVDTPEDKSDDLTLGGPATSGQDGHYGGWFEPLLAIDTVMVTTTFTVVEPRDPAHGDFTPVERTKSVTFPAPDTSDAYQPTLDFRYSAWGNSFQIRDASFPGMRTLPHVVNAEPITPPNFIGCSPDARTFFVRSPDRRIWVVRDFGICAAKEICRDSSSLTAFRVARQADNRLVVVGAARDGQMLITTESTSGGSFSGLSSLGGALKGNFAIEANSDGRLEIFARGSDRALWHAWQQSNGSWSAWASLGGVLPEGAGIAALRDSEGHICVFYNGMDAQIWMSRQGTPWSGHASLGGPRVAGPLAAARNADGRLEIFAQGRSGDILHKWQWGSSWSGWESLGGLFVAGSLTVANHADGRIILFVEQTDRQLAARSQISPNSGWGSWTVLARPMGAGWSAPVPPADPIAVGRRVNGALVVGWRDGGTLHSLEQSSANGGFTGWRTHGTLPPAPPLSAPELQSAVPGNHYVSLDWRDVEGADGYHAMCKRVSGGDVRQQDTAVSNCSFPGLDNDVEYEFWVIASNACHESPESNHLRCTPRSRPDLVPSYLMASETVPSAGKTFIVQGMIINAGSAASSASRCRILREGYLSNGSSPAPQETIIAVPPISPGQSVPIEWEQTINQPATYYYTLFADCDNAVQELREDNNTLVLTIVVS